MPFLKPLKSENGKWAALMQLSKRNGPREYIKLAVSNNIYHGTWRNGKIDGVGTEFFYNKSRYKYTGEWKENRRHGKGVLNRPIGPVKKEDYARKYVGEWRGDKREGFGTNYYANGDRYEGFWLAGKRDGWGRMFYINGDKYEGEWKNDHREGRGVIQYANGNWYEGHWLNDRKSGEGVHHNKRTGEVCFGGFVDNQPREVTYCSDTNPDSLMIPKEILGKFRGGSVKVGRLRKWTRPVDLPDNVTHYTCDERDFGPVL